MPLTVGTAGHIDHGKTTLVEALTGKNTDRLPQERERGISIDLGYAPLELPDGTQLSVVDVPGHERFVRTMVAGATGIDLFLLVIDAAEGARPQTLEHLAILRLLGIDRGVVALTKSDLVDEETLELARAEAEELVPGAPVVAVSASTGAGLDELRAVLMADGAGAGARGARNGDAPLRRPCVLAARDRHRRDGDAVVGLARRGRRAARRARCAPGARTQRAGARPGRRARRAGAACRRRAAGGRPQRAAGAATRSSRRARIRRATASTSTLEPLAEIPPRVLVHHGTDAVLARVVQVGERWAQLRLAEPVVAARGDRVVLRAETTVGGGHVIDPAPPRHASAERMELVERGAIAAIVHEPVRADTIRHLADGEIEGVESADGWVFSAAWLAELRRSSSGGSPPRTRSIPVCRRRRSRGRRRSCRCSASSGAARSSICPGATAELGARADAAAALEAQLGLEPLKIDDAVARALPRGAGPPRPRRRRLRDLGRGVRAAPATRSSPNAKRRAASRLPASATCSASAARRRSSCSSASTADGLTRRVGDERVLRRRGTLSQ